MFTEQHDSFKAKTLVDIWNEYEVNLRKIYFEILATTFALKKKHTQGESQLSEIVKFTPPIIENKEPELSTHSRNAIRDEQSL